MCTRVQRDSTKHALNVLEDSLRVFRISLHRSEWADGVASCVYALLLMLPKLIEACVFARV
jgi:hypothetical protein